MEWNEKLQNIVDYVENHLQRTEDPVDKEEVSRMAECSYDFFQKVFSYMNGLSFSDYIRFRKLTLAGYDLQSTNMKIVDISYKYGYDSPTSFTKAFQQFHGISPREVRREDAELRVFPKMKIFCRQQFSWRIVQKEAFRLIGKRIRISCVGGVHYQKIPEFWNDCQKNGVYAKLVSMDGGRPKGVFGVFGNYDESSEEIEYSIMVEADREVPTGFCETMIPGTAWAVFDCRGRVPEAIQEGWKYLNQEWLVKYPFRHAACPELEWYSDENAYEENYLSQIWIPIVEED